MTFLVDVRCFREERAKGNLFQNVSHGTDEVSKVSEVYRKIFVLRYSYTLDIHV
jgi:hypothetical protein